MATESSPSPWTNWWDGWIFPDLDLEENPDLRMKSTTTSNISLRSLQNPSGLFDNEHAGMQDDLEAGNDLDFMIDDVFRGQEDKSFSLNPIDEQNVDNFLNSMAATFPGDDFLNSFIDLSNFSTEDKDVNVPIDTDVTSSDSVVPVIHIPETEAGKTLESGSQKRKFSEIEYVVVDSAAAGLDHDYVSKKIRTNAQQSVVALIETDIVSPKPQETGVEKYRQRRINNNIASKRSREIRKMKFSQMETEAERLVGENAKLREKIEEMEKMAKEMKATLISAIAGKN